MSSLVVRTVAGALSGVSLFVTISIGPGRFTLSAGTDGTVKASAAVVSAGGLRAQGVNACLVGCSEADTAKSVDKLTFAEGPFRLRTARDSAGHAEATVGLSAGVRNKSGTAAVEFGFQKTISQAEVGVAGLHGLTSHQRALGALVRGAFQSAPPKVGTSPAGLAQMQNIKLRQQLIANLRGGRSAAALNVPSISAGTLRPSPLLNSTLGGRSLAASRLLTADAKRLRAKTYSLQPDLILGQYSSR